MTFTLNEQQFLAEAGIGRLATVSPDGVVQNNPTNYRVNADGTVDIGGMRMRASRKYRNVEAGSRVSFVVDQQVSLDPYVIRGIEIRGTAEALDDAEPPFPPQERAVIRIHPERIVSWGIDGGSFDFTSRRAEKSAPQASLAPGGVVPRTNSRRTSRSNRPRSG